MEDQSMDEPLSAANDEVLDTTPSEGETPPQSPDLATATMALASSVGRFAILVDQGFDKLRAALENLATPKTVKPKVGKRGRARKAKRK